MTPHDSSVTDARLEVMAAHAGAHARNALKHHWTNASFSTWDEAVAELAVGITVTLPCWSYPPDGEPTKQRHRLLLLPDGSVAPLDHPDEDDLSNDRADAERVMAGLAMLSEHSHVLASCVEAALILPRRGARIGVHRAGVNPLQGNDTVLGLKIRTLHTLVQWAVAIQSGSSRFALTAELGQETLRYGLTPQHLAEAADAGWEVSTALPWLQWRVPLDVASAWCAAGRSSRTDARMCGLGESLDGQSPWLAVGFTIRQADSWSRVEGATPALAWQWHVRGLPIRLFRDTSALTPGSSLPSVWHQAMVEWVDAGVPASEVLTWFINGMPLAVAQEWAACGLTCDDYLEAVSWGHSGPPSPSLPASPPSVSPADLVPLLRYRLAPVRRDLAVLACLIAGGLTPRVCEQHVAAAYEAVFENQMIPADAYAIRLPTLRARAWEQALNSMTVDLMQGAG